MSTELLQSMHFTLYSIEVLEIDLNLVVDQTNRPQTKIDRTEDRPE